MSTAFAPAKPTAVKPKVGAVALLGKVVRTAVPYGQENLALWFGLDWHGRLVLTGGHVGSRRPVEMFGNSYVPASGSYRCGGVQDGFWCGYDASVAANSNVFVGYVVGDTATVDITVDGRVHRATTAPWSKDSRVRFWWLALPAPSDGSMATVSRMIARNASGAIMARASGAIAHG
jgi:hypothetical protein